MKNIALGAAIALFAMLPFQSHAQTDKATAIISAETHTCWDVQDYSVSDGAVIQMYPCTGTSNQSWQLQVYNFNDQGFLARIVNVGSGMCAALESLDPASGAIGLRQHTCDVNDLTQQWQIDGNETRYATSASNQISFLAHPVSRRIINVGTHWCVTAQTDFYRPYQRGDCSSTTDNKIRFAIFGL